MKNIVSILYLLLLMSGLQAQGNLQVDGSVSIGQMDKDNSGDSVIVRLHDGTLAIRDVLTLNQWQILSVANDTIFLSNGGFVKLPASFDGQYSSLSGAPTNVSQFSNDSGYLMEELDGSTTNEIQSISRTGLTVNLDLGGGSFQDSVNVYFPGPGIDITNNSISVKKSPWYLGKDTLGGIVFCMYKGSDSLEHGLIVAKTESTAQWESAGSTTNASRTWDGMYNMNLMGVMNASAAKSYVQSLGMSWYLPAIDELSLMWHQRFHINRAMQTGGHTLLGLGFYWSSTEFNGSQAMLFTFFNGNVNANSKTTIYSVRAIRAF